MPESTRATSEKQNKSAKPVPPVAVRSAPASMGATVESGVLLAMADPRQATAGSILTLQRLTGNRSVTRHLQAKLTVGPVADRFELEADRVAEQVLAMSMPAASPAAPAAQRQTVPEEEEVQAKPLLQRAAPEEEEAVQTKPLAAGITPLQRSAEEEEEVQGKPLLQRAGPEEEEELQGKRLLQRAGPEEEEELQGKRLLQRAGPEEEEELQGKRLLQRAGPEEEEELQGKRLLQRAGPEEEEELQGKRLLQRAGPEEEEELQGKRLLQRAGPEEEEELQGKRLLQRAGPEEEEDLQGKRLLQRAGPEEEEELQGKRARPAGDGSFEAGEAVESRLSASRGGGSPLPGDVRAYMEPRFGADFGGVRVHAGSESASLNRQISAQAFTHAQDIYMGEGRYAPGTTAGDRLLAHELTHVVQQSGGAVTRKPSAPAGLVQRDGGKKFTGEVPRTGENSEEYTKFLQANPDMLSDKERPFAKFLLASKKPERGPKPPTGQDSTAYVQFLLDNPDMLSEKEKIFFKVYTGRDVPEKAKPEEEESAPPEPSRWEKFKALFKKKPVTAVSLLVKQLESEFKGYAGVKGFFTGTRKAQALSEQQHGVLTDAQERSIDMLAELDPGALTKLGFLLPKDAAAKAHEFFLKQDALADLPAKQQMQIITYQHRFPVGGPKAASKEDQRKLITQRQKEQEAKREKLSPLARGLQDVRSGKGRSPVEGEDIPEPLPPVSDQLPEKVEPKGGMPSSEKIVLKAGKEGEETLSHRASSYLDLVYAYVRKAGVQIGMISIGAEQLGQDFVDVRQGKERYEELAKAKKESLDQMSALGGKTGGPMKKLMARLKWAEENQVKLLNALHESDFQKADADAERRAEKAQKSSMDATQEKATIDYLYDQILAGIKPVEARQKQASRAEKKDPVWKHTTQLLEENAADETKRLAQQAKMSMDVVELRRTAVDYDVTHVQKKPIDRLPGTMRKIGGKIVTGALSAGLGFLTFGLVGVKANTGAKGYMGQGLQKTGRSFKVTFLNDIRNQIAQFRTTVTARPTGPSVADITSALLRAFNEIIVQNVINVAGKIATITGLLATLLMLAAPVTMGGTAGPAAILATISSIATFVALIAAGVKVAVNAVRLTIDGIAALVNAYKYRNPHMANALVNRVKQSGMESISDTAQFAGAALGTSTGNVIKGHGFTNMFNPMEAISTNVSSTIAKEGPKLGLTIGGTVASTSIGTVLPVVGNIVPGVGAGTGKQGEGYSLYTQHPDEMHRTGKTKAGGGFLPPTGQKNRLEAQSTPNKPGNFPIDPTLPPWMRAEMEKENKLRADVFKDRITLGASQIEAVNSKASDIASKLGVATSESDKLQEEASTIKSKGGKELDSESMEMAKSQSGVMDESGGAVKDTMAFLQHSKTELRKLPEEKQD